MQQHYRMEEKREVSKVVLSTHMSATKKPTEATVTGLEMVINFSFTPPAGMYLISTEILWLTRILACVPDRVVGRQ